MRLKERYSIAKRCSADSFITLPGNSKKGTDDIVVRVIEVSLPSGELEYLATNIFDTSITSLMFKELYFLRWPVEIKFLEL